MVKKTDLTLPSAMQVAEAEEKLAIAIVYSRSPLPMNFADQKTVAHFIEFLSSRGHSIDLYCTDDAGMTSVETDNWYSDKLNNLYMYKQSFRKKFLGIIISLLRLQPLQIGFFFNKDINKDLKINLCKYDVVYTYYIRSAEVSRSIASNKILDGGRPISILAMQLSQTLNTRRIYENATNIFDRVLYFFESKLVERYESTIWKDFDNNILIGNKDVEAISDSCNKLGKPIIDKTFMCAHGVDVHKFYKPDIDIDENLLVYCGVMRTPTNVQACLWFYKNVWPDLKKDFPKLKWFIVGREPSNDLMPLNKSPGITVTGTVDDPSEYISRACICINPMQAAGGMQNKLIEYLASKRPVVATSVANEGIYAVPDKHLIIADSDDDFKKAIKLLLVDSDRRRELSINGHDFIVKKWSWETHFLKLEKVYNKSFYN